MGNWDGWKRKQPYVVKLLVNSMNKNRLPHAYLFEGGTGVGKLAIAKQLAKTLYCQFRDGVEACHECQDCRRISSRNHPDVRFFSPDGSSLKIQQIRDLKKEFSFVGVESHRKLYIIDHADRMTTQAANGLLTFLEEPHMNTTIILLTEQIQRMLPTIVSRCQTVSFQPLTRNERYRKLTAENISGSLALLAASLTDDDEAAKKWAKDEWFAQARNIVIQLNEDLLERPYQTLLTVQEQWVPHFKEREQIELGFHLLLLWFRDVLFMKLEQDEEIVFCDERKLLERFHLRYSLFQISRQVETMMEAKKRLNANVAPQLVVEQALLKVQEG